MQISLTDLIDQFTAALDAQDGLLSARGAFLSEDQKLNFQVCAVLIGITSELFVEHNIGTVSIHPIHAKYVRRHLAEAQQALLALPAIKEGEKPPMIDEFSIGTAAMLGDADDFPQLKQFLSGTHMMAVTKSISGRYESLTTTLSTRGEALDAIDLLRPDIGMSLRERMTQRSIKLDEAGDLPATPKQIRELQQSYRHVAHNFSQRDAATAQAALEKIHSESLPKPKVTKPVTDGKIIKRTVAQGREAVVLSTRPREESPDHFMVELEIMQPLLDYCKNLAELRKHPNGTNAKYLPTKGDNGQFLVSCPSLEQADYELKMLRALLQDGNKIKVDTDYSESRKHPKIWLNIPHELLDTIQDEATLLHDLRDEVRATFNPDDNSEAQALKDDLLAYATPRIYVGQHASAVEQSRAHEAGQVNSK